MEKRKGSYTIWKYVILLSNSDIKCINVYLKYINSMKIIHRTCFNEAKMRLKNKGFK